jgi:hypothetical protein
MIDPDGDIPFFVITGLVGAVIGGIVGGVIAANNGGNVWAGIAIGAAAGALIGSGVGMAAGVTLAGSAFATTGAVITGANTLAATVSTSGVAAGANLVANNTSRALGGTAPAVAQTTARTTTSNPFVANVCFVAGTSVLTESGLAAIETVKAGDLVWAKDTETGEIALKYVVQTFVNQASELVHIKVGGQTISVTPEHPFWVAYKGWISAAELRAGDVLVSYNEKSIAIDEVSHETLKVPVFVYNFEVKDFHTYYVGKSSILVHNTCPVPQNIYTSIKNAPGYNPHFIRIQNGLTKGPVDNKQLLFQLNQVGSGWQKVYQNGWINGQKVSLHYFQDSSGKVFDFWIQNGWSIR